MGKPNKNLRRLHYKIYFPENTKNMLKEFVQQFRSDFNKKDPELTYHASEELKEDEKAKEHNTTIPKPKRTELFNRKNKVVEIYEILDKNNVRKNKIQKIVIRVPHLHHKLDFTYVVAREGFIVSAWANDKHDTHRLTDSMKEYYHPNKDRMIA